MHVDVFFSLVPTFKTKSMCRLGVKKKKNPANGHYKEYYSWVSRTPYHIWTCGKWHDILTTIFLDVLFFGLNVQTATYEVVPLRDYTAITSDHVDNNAEIM